MNRLWVAVIFLAILIGTGAFAGTYTAQAANDMEAKIESVREALATETPEYALIILDSAKTDWERRKPLLALFASVPEMDGIDEHFAILSSTLTIRSREETDPELVALTQKMRSISNHEQLHWKAIV